MSVELDGCPTYVDDILRSVLEGVRVHLDLSDNSSSATARLKRNAQP
jgi:hypothetical protein